MASETSSRLRPEGRQDAALIYQLFLEGVLEQMGLTSETMGPFEALIDMQARSRDQTHAADFPDAVREVLMARGEPAGRLMTALVDGDVYIVDIAVLQGCRRQGLAAEMIRTCQQRAAAAGQAVTADISVMNHASLALFRSQGFEIREEPAEAYVVARWQSPA